MKLLKVIKGDPITAEIYLHQNGGYIGQSYTDYDNGLGQVWESVCTGSLVACEQWAIEQSQSNPKGDAPWQLG
jgi:hypothetical protein